MRLALSAIGVVGFLALSPAFEDVFAFRLVWPRLLAVTMIAKPPKTKRAFCHGWKIANLSAQYKRSHGDLTSAPTTV
jgi:hypothetical protein